VAQELVVDDLKALLQFQLNGSFNLLIELIEGMTDEEWEFRPFAGANLVGFTVWHCARTIDWAVNCVLRGSPELADRPEWRDVRIAEAGFGAGASRDGADTVAHDVRRARVHEYANALRAGTLSWLAELPLAELSGAIDLRASHAEKREYMAPAVWAELEDLDGIPKWQFLARPCVSHLRVHSGEVRSQLEAARAGAPT
jgi:DinB superfamily